MEAISRDHIRLEVHNFWESFTGKSKNRFEQVYSPTATCFALDGRRSEPARLMWVRRGREFFGPMSAVGARLGVINVQLLGPELAVASYPLHFTVVRTMSNGRHIQSDIPFGRATQVFQRDESGALRIIHEHLSSAEPVSSKELPKE